MDAMVAVDTQFMREINSTAILARLRTEPSMSVSALAKATGLSRQAVTRSLNKLEAAGVVEFSAPDRRATRSGRPPQLVRFRAEAGYVLGLSVDPQEVRIAVSDLAGAVVYSNSAAMMAESAREGARGVPTAERVTRELLAEIDKALTATGIDRERVWHASLGTPGIVDTATGVVRLLPSMPDLTGDVLVRTLGDDLRCPVYVDNDVKLATQGERWRGAKRDDESLVFIHWGERVGAGIVLHGQLYRGATNDAGDIGFLGFPALDGENLVEPVQAHSPGLGWFEEWIGAETIARRAAQAASDRGDTELAERIAAAEDAPLAVVLDAAGNDNPAAIEAIDLAAARFATGIAVIRVILDPKLIVIGGPMALAGDLLLTRVRAHLEREPLTPPALEISSLGADAVVQGAIHHCLAEIESTKFQRGRTRRTAGRQTSPVS